MKPITDPMAFVTHNTGPPEHANDINKKREKTMQKIEEGGGENGEYR